MGVLGPCGSPGSATYDGIITTSVKWYLLVVQAIDLSSSSQVKSKMAPHLKINFMIYTIPEENLMRLSQFAQ